jgi:hypothetical protein
MDYLKWGVPPAPTILGRQAISKSLNIKLTPAPPHEHPSHNN